MLFVVPGDGPIKHTCNYAELVGNDDNDEKPRLCSFKGDADGIKNEVVDTTNTTEQQGLAAVTNSTIPGANICKEDITKMLFVVPGDGPIKHTCNYAELVGNDDNDEKPRLCSFKGDADGIKNEVVDTTNTTEQQGLAAVTTFSSETHALLHSKRGTSDVKEDSIVDDCVVVENFDSTLISNGPHSLTYLSLMTLENPLAISKKSLKSLKKASPSFIKGWLQDEVIASYIYTLTNHFDDVKFCEPTTALILSFSLCESLKLLWNNVNLQLVKKVLIPFNPSGSHWILIYINIDEKKIFVLDPMSNQYLEDDGQHQQCVKVSKELLSRKFGLHNINNVSSPGHTLQQDSFNCGVYVCYYAKQICEEKRLEDCFDPLQFRRHIYREITRKCLSNLQVGFYNNYNVCKVCQGECHNHKECVKCTKCPQRFHCNCVQMSKEQADEDVNFSCP